MSDCTAFDDLRRSGLDEDPLHVVLVVEGFEGPEGVRLVVVVTCELNHPESRTDTPATIDLQAIVVRLTPPEILVLLAVLRRARRD